MLTSPHITPRGVKYMLAARLALEIYTYVIVASSGIFGTDSIEMIFIVLSTGDHIRLLYYMI